MERARQGTVLVIGLVLVGLGLLNIVYRDTLLTWQPFPEGVGGRIAFAYVSAAALIVGGVGLFIPTWRQRGAMLAALWIALWAIAFHLPHVLMAHDVGSLLGLAESTASALGLATLTGWFDSERRALLLRSGFGLCLLVFGLSHFVYADFTAQMVPGWLPQRLGIAYLTGTIHMLMGLGLLAGVRVRTAAAIEATMMSSFVLLLHIPGVVAAPRDRLQLTMLGMAALLTCAAWLVATWQRLPERRLLSRRAPS